MTPSTKQIIDVIEATGLYTFSKNTGTRLDFEYVSGKESDRLELSINANLKGVMAILLGEAEALGWHKGYQEKEKEIQKALGICPEN